MNNLTIKTMASSSSGNCYSISDNTTTLLIECGIPIAMIKRSLNYKLSSVSGCLVSHQHQDHCKAAKDIMRAGIDIYTGTGTIEALKLSGHRVNQIEHKKQFKIGTWTIVPFHTVHDDLPDPLGFFMVSGENRVLFATDTAFIKPRFVGLTHILIESNYQTDILERNVESGALAVGLKNRILFSHMSLTNVLGFLEDIDRSQLKEIFLIHLSNTNSDETKMKRAVMRLTGIPVTICCE